MYNSGFMCVLREWIRPPKALIPSQMAFVELMDTVFVSCIHSTGATENASAVKCNTMKMTDQIAGAGKCRTKAIFEINV